MVEPSFPLSWKIKSSTSHFFPVGSAVQFSPAKGGASRFELDLDLERQATSWSFEVELPEVTTLKSGPSVFKGDFRDKKGRRFRIVFTFCPDEDPGGRRYLCGALFDRPSSDLGDGATGVWVAEEEREPPAGEK